jgi:hypothetical protein
MEFASMEGASATALGVVKIALLLLLDLTVHLHSLQALRH